MSTESPQLGRPHFPPGSTRCNGFDVILGNPPWERVKLQEQEFFAHRDPAVAGAPNAAARKKAIAALRDTNPALLAEFQEATRRAEGESHLLRSSGRYPLCGRGDINTYAVFAESMRDAISPTGRMGVIVPTGIATDDTTKFFFGDMVRSRTLASLLSFENEEFIFPGVHHSYCFSLLIVSGIATTQDQMEFVFFARQIEHLSPQSGRRFVLTPDDIVLLNPNTLTCPVFRSERDAEITKAIYRRVPVLIREATAATPESNPWGLTFMAMFHMANASGLFIPPEVACPAVRAALSGRSFVNVDSATAAVGPSTGAADPATRGVDPSTTTVEGLTTTKQGSTTTGEGSTTLVEGSTAGVDRGSTGVDGSDATQMLRELPFLPLYEAKMLHQFDHRWATYAREGADWLSTPILTKVNNDGKEEPDTRDVTPEEQANPAMLAAPRYWVSAAEVEARLIKTDKDGSVTWRWEREWLIGYRDISRANNDRTLIATIVPRFGISNKIPLMVFEDIDAKQAACLIACMNSFVVDYAARQKVGGTTLNFFIVKQFPVLPASSFAARCPWDESKTLSDWIAPRALELVYTAHDLAGFARDLGYDGLPFRWDPVRRAQIRAELDAAFFHLYGVSRDDAAYIMDTFLVFKARDEERNGGVYKTKETILEIYDEMARETIA